jgi:Cupin superfamily protein
LRDGELGERVLLEGVQDSTLIDIDLEAFGDAFAKRSIQVRHGLSDHPLFTLEGIAELADRLPPDSVRRQSGQLPYVYTDGYVDVGTGPPSQTILDIERNGVRVMLRDIHQDPEYADVIHECLDQVEAALGKREGGMVHRAGYLFISAPAATTPMHFDVEHSFLLQVRGTKNVHVAAFADRPEILTRERERYLDGRKSDFEAMQAAAETFRIESGLGVYLPSYVPHWVDTEAGVSISFSIPWFTAFCRRAENVYRINSIMRRLRLSPKPMGASKPVDELKVRAHRAWIRMRAARARHLTSR